MYRKEKQARCKLNLFGFITSEGVGELFVFENKATGLDYKNNLNDYILPAIERKLGHRNFILQQDNAATHSCNLVYNYLREEGRKLLIWPPKCPMFNIIEYCWSLLQRKVNRRIHQKGQPRNEHTLFRYCVLEWNSITKETIQNLYESLPQLINKYIEEEM